MSTTPTTDQPPGFDTSTPTPPRKPWWRRKLVIIPAGALALILAASIGAAATGGGSRTGSASQRPATQAGIYANANQIVQALKAHHVPVTNVVADSGFWSGEGATSGVWATTAPGDSAAVFGGSDNPVQDTEIVVFQNHAKAVAYANLGTDPNAGSPDPDHETILGTNWAVDAATPAASGLCAALGGTLIPSVPASTAPAAPSAPASSQPAPPASSQPATPASPAPAVPAGPTMSQQQALDAAQSYLNLGSGFSRQGLIDQLDSQYGNKFSVADATWAVDHSGADWNAQAVMAAKGYMQLGGFSRASLIDQLTSAYGSKFTYAQASYAADRVGL
jgi:hypothetical protein